MNVLRFVSTMLLLFTGTLAIHAAAVPEPFTPTRFTVVDEGKVGAPDVVLIPGLASGRDIWDAEAKRLAPNYRLHLVQVDGFAGQPAGANASGDILPALVEQLHEYIEAGHMHPVVIGHSMGGLLALMLADKYPQDVRKMVIVDALPFYGSILGADATVESVKPQVQAMLAQLSALPPDQYAALQPMLASQMVIDPAGQKVVAKNATESDRTVMLKAMQEDLSTDLRPDIAHIETPTLVLFAVDARTLQPDPAQYEATVRSSYKPMPHVTVIKVDDSRHFIMYDQPAKFDAAIEAFLK